MTEDKAPSVVQEAFERLGLALEEQHQKYTNGTNAKADVSAMSITVSAIIDFLVAAAPKNPNLATVLVNLLGELSSVCEGQGSSVFDAIKRKWDGHSKPIAQQFRWAVAAACVTLLKENGTSIKAATQQVAKGFKQTPFPLPGPRKASAAGSLDPAVQLKNWRDKLLKPSSPLMHRKHLLCVYENALECARRYGGNLSANVLIEYLHRDLIAARPAPVSLKLHK